VDDFANWRVSGYIAGMELEFLDWLRARTSDASGMALGLCDDAAVLTPPGGKQLVVTTDALVDGTHFETGKTPLELIGRKSLAVNLSDLAAMAAKPSAVFISIVVPKRGAAGLSPQELLRGVYEGLLPLADEFDVTIAGGDTNMAEAPLTIAITLIGYVQEGRAWLRSGARPGDSLVVTGPLGGSLGGHHMTFQPRVNEALKIARDCQVHAALDISDGLLLDLSRMCQASGVGAELDAPAIPVSHAANELAGGDAEKALERAMSDGEDFELLIALPEDEVRTLIASAGASCSPVVIGRIVNENGLWLCRGGNRESVVAKGYEHGVAERPDT
jgi:thiamine-monophosphate kinase